jgi:uracil phosphoribosyltransferase
MSSDAFRILDHPLAAAQLSILRTRTTLPNEFRRALHKLALLLLVEAARGWETETATLESPLATFTGSFLPRSIVLVPILRAGLGLQEGMLPLVPEAAIGHNASAFTDPVTLRPPVKYFSCFRRIWSRPKSGFDPMLATAIAPPKPSRSSSWPAQRECNWFACSPARRASPKCQRAHPDVPDRCGRGRCGIPNERGYIVPGLGRRWRSLFRHRLGPNEKARFPFLVIPSSRRVRGTSHLQSAGPFLFPRNHSPVTARSFLRAANRIRMTNEVWRVPLPQRAIRDDTH